MYVDDEEGIKDIQSIILSSLLVASWAAILLPLSSERAIFIVG